jgi:hypothetical protein
MLRALAISSVAIAALAGQTALPVQQLRGVTSASGQVLVTLPSGAVSLALLDSSFSIDTSNGRPVLRVTIPSNPRLVRVKAIAAATPAQSFQISGAVIADQLLVFRNGLLQSEGDDYEFSANSTEGTVTFRPGPTTAIQPGDLVQFVALF